LLFNATTYYPSLTGCNELRVADANRIEVPVQVYGSLPNCHVIFQASLAASSSRTYYIYYGNASAPAPSYTSDMTDTVAGSLHTIRNTYFDLDLDTSATSGIISRMRLPQGMNAHLPLSTSTNANWGWHQICSSVDGNITGKASLCQGGNAQASGLSMVQTLSGPLVREYTLTSVKAANTYTITYRFFANAPYYQYTLTQAGTGALVMNNFWYQGSDFSLNRYSDGTNGDVPYLYYNGYENLPDDLRIVSSAPIATGRLDGTENYVTFLGGTAYNIPTAAGLSLYVATGVNSSALSGVLARLAAPLSVSTYGGAETRPAATYGSPYVPTSPGTDWVPVTFTWQNPAIQNQTVHWRVTFYDVSGNVYTTTPDRSFWVSNSAAEPLQVGWNLVSFNLHPANTAIGSVLANIAGHYDLVYAWDASGAHSSAGNWLRYDPAFPFLSTLTNLDETQGFWIHMTTADTLDVTGTIVANSSISLLDNVGGWNLVGYPSNTNRSLPGAITTETNFVYSYHPSDVIDPWKLFDRDFPIPELNDLQTMTPGWGYWMYVTADSNWSVGY
jgi:hypothetical protein